MRPIATRDFNRGVDLSGDKFQHVSPDAHIVALRASGEGCPLFCFPGAGGNTFVFREMIESMPAGSRAYGIDMEWLCDERGDFKVEEIAAFYLASVRRVQTHGPFNFCGYSFGALVAYEMARLLADEGEEIGLVALLDAPNPAQLSNLPMSASAQFRQAYLFDRLQKYAQFLASGDIRSFLERGLTFVVSRAGPWFTPALKSVCRLWQIPLPEIVRSNDPGFLKAWSIYNPEPSNNEVVCFRVKDRGPEHDFDSTMGWQACAKGGVRVHIVPGGHVDMMRMPAAQFIAEIVASSLRGVREA